jgi:hypothetical protein
MIKIRGVHVATLGACAALAVGAPEASAYTLPPIPTALDGLGGLGNLGPIGNNPAVAGACGTPTGAEGQGGTGGTSAQACLGAGLSFIGPQVGQIASVIGPTIISPGFVGNNIVVAAGNGAAGP